MDARVANEVSLTDLFDQFIEASTMRNVLSIFHRILNYADLNPCEFNVFFPKLKRAVMSSRLKKNWKAKALFSKIDKKAAHRCYSNTKAPTPLGNRSTTTTVISDNQPQQQNNSQHNSQECLDDSLLSSSRQYYSNNNALQHYNCLVIGSGPAGLRTAIELQLLGASRVVVVEKRSRFSRNNVLHLWPFVIDDLKSLGAKKFYGKFCAGSIDHISIRQLQLILLKICLMIGCDFRDSCSYLSLCPATIKHTTVTVSNNSDSIKCDLYNNNDKQELSDFKKVSSSLQQPQSTETEGEKGKEDEDKKDASETTTEKKDCDDEEKENESDKAGDSYQNVPSTSSASDGRTSISTSNNKTPIISLPSLNPKRGENLRGAHAHFQSEYQLQEKELHSIEWDVIIGADGRRNTLSKFFPRKEFRGRLAIAITANFINRQTPAEASVAEISGLSFIYNQDMFNALAFDTNIQLENICYYKDDTHYFVMTAKKKSLLERGVLINDYAATQDLLSDSNVDRQALLKYAKDAAYWTTGLEPLDFALNHYGQEDCAMFDFTSMYAASNACKALRTKDGGLALVSLVGDSLLEPFWPTGSGCARGFLSSFDAAWMCRQWAVNKCAVIDYHGSISSRSSRNRSPNVCGPATYNRMALSVMAERESIYRILAQTTSENLQQNYSHWTLNPHSRYPNLNRHLVVPSQVEHLISDNEVTPMKLDKNKLAATESRQRRIKSPNNNNNGTGLVKSPKKLKSANASPVAQPKYARGCRSKSLGKAVAGGYKSKSRHELSIHDTYLEFEKSYNNLADDDRPGRHHYLHHGRPDCDIYDDYFDSSVSGTLPSSNNLLSLEARRARDIDECLRQRRQKTQLHVVKSQLMEKFRGQSLSRDDGESSTADGNSGGGTALFNELRRLRELRAKGREGSKPRDLNGPLTLLNSMRRCASFAERVKSFENKMGHQQAESTPATPRIPIDSVKNLAQFGTLQELFVGNSTLDKEPKKSKIPIMKLSKDDWNVKCWEKRLAAYKQKTGGATTKDGFYGSTKSLNRASYEAATAVAVAASTAPAKPAKQVEVFKGRIKEMAEKLKKVRDDNPRPVVCTNENVGPSVKGLNGRSQGWVSHLRRELIKGAERPQQVARQAMNPSVPNKPIKKLFEDEEDEDDGIDINKHYDHLCINRPTNKYLSKNGYTSHLVRNKYNSATSKVVNVPQTSTASKQAYLNMLTSRGSSASSTLSDYSTNTGGSSSGGGGGGGCDPKTQEVIKCFRCKTDVGLTDKISIGGSNLHRGCLTCSGCGLTLRTSEIQHYLNLVSNSSEAPCDFICSICRPNMRAELSREAADRLAKVEENVSMGDKKDNLQPTQPRLKSREEFLNEKINYNELYKNILNENSEAAVDKIDRLESSSRETTPASSSVTNKSLYEDAMSKQESLSSAHRLLTQEISVSPITVTLPLTNNDETCGEHNDCEKEKKPPSPTSERRIDRGYRIARSETIDGTEQVTLILPSVTTPIDNFDCERASQRPMIDEDELDRILHIENSSSSNKSKSSKSKKANADETQNSSTSGDSDKEGEEDTSDENEPHDANGELSDDSSSLNSPPNTEDYDDDDDADDKDGEDNEVEQNSTYEDFLTSEEFGAVSDRETDEILNDDAPKICVPGE